MDPSTTLIDELTDDVAGILAVIESATAQFASRAGIKCRSGCGQCCLNQNVEARVIEFLPLARYLFEIDMAHEIYELATTSKAASCILYRPDPSDSSLGRCGHYAYRPSVCRLFGFAAVRDKNKRPQLAACQRHKKLQPEIVAAAQEEIDKGAEVPMFSDFGMQLSALTTSDALMQMLPINQALARAIEKVALSRR